MKTRNFILGMCFLAYSINATAQDTVTFTWQGSSDPFFIGVTFGESYTIRWGDGTDSTYTSATMIENKSYTGYNPANTYTVTVTTATNNGRVEWLIFSLFHPVSSLDISKCTPSIVLACNNNQLPLSDLYAASQVISNPSNKSLGTQTLPPQTATLGQTLFSTQSLFGGIYTAYNVTKNGSPASPSNYTVINGTITFNDTGTYKVVMTNSAIVSDPSSPAQVIVDITVALPFSESITFTWQANTIDGKDIVITATDGYIIDWGNGHTDTFQAGVFEFINYTYPTAGSYTVSIAATTPNCNFTFLYFFPELQISRLDVSKSQSLESLTCSSSLLDSLDVSNHTALEDLDCSENNLTYLNVSGCPSLYFFVCRDNQLSSLNLNGCASLTYLSCSDNLLDSLNVRNNIILESIDCSNNNISSLNLSNNTALERLYCSNNQISSLNLNNTILTELSCDTNHLQLSDLYIASQKISVQSNKQLGFQTLSPQTVTVGDTLFQTESVFNSIYTTYSATKNGSPASTYTTSNGKLIFSDTGIYSVTMTNSAIISDANFPAKVMIDITVVLPVPETAWKYTLAIPIIGTIVNITRNEGIEA